MSIDPRKTVDTPGTDPNKGLNTRSFLLVVLAALFVLLVVLALVAHKSSTKVTPERETKPSTRMQVPARSPGSEAAAGRATQRV